MPVAVCDVYGAIVPADPAMATEWGETPGRLRSRNVLDLFRPQEATQVERIAQALRLRHRSRYPISVRWDAADGVWRHGELTADPVSDSAEASTALLVMLRVLGACPGAAEPSAPLTNWERYVPSWASASRIGSPRTSRSGWKFRVTRSIGSSAGPQERAATWRRACSRGVRPFPKCIGCLPRGWVT